MPVPPSQPGEHTQHTLFIKIFVVVYAAGDKDDARITKAFFFCFFGRATKLDQNSIFMCEPSTA